MNVGRIDSINFTSRCTAVKAGQQACSAIAKEFPSVSPSLVFLRSEVLRENNKLPRNINIYLHGLSDKIEGVRNEYSFEHSELDYSAKLMQTVKDARMANCGERAHIANVILRQNGYNSRTTLLTANGDSTIGHEVCCFNTDNSLPEEASDKTIIVDPWLGICDFASEVFNRYKFEFGDIFSKIRKLKNVDMNKVKFGIASPEEKEYRWTKEELDKLKLAMPKYNFPEKLRGTYQK